MSIIFAKKMRKILINVYSYIFGIDRAEGGVLYNRSVRGDGGSTCLLGSVLI